MSLRLIASLALVLATVAPTLSLGVDGRPPTR